MSKSLTVQVDLPSDALLHHPWEPERIAHDMRALWLVEQVRERPWVPERPRSWPG